MQTDNFGAARQRGPRTYALLPSKVHIPRPISGAIARPGVIEKLDRALSCPLTSVVASAGYGKTTAVASWASDLPDKGKGDIRVAWYSVSQQDVDPAVFWGYVVAALCAADPSLDAALDGFRLPDQPRELPRAIGSLILALGESDFDTVLVLEDFHAVQDNAALSDAVRLLVQDLPANAHLVVTSRRPLSLPLARLRIAGSLVEVGEDDLRFSVGEEQAFFAGAGTSNVPAKPEELARIDAYTHGWPAGCRLVSMLGAPDPNDPAVFDQVRSGMSDYLFEEVYAGLPANQRDFLVKTSVVDSFSAPLAAALTGLGRDEAFGLAEALATGNLFVERIERPGEEVWYRYHMLFSDMLRSRAQASDPEGLTACQRAARDWYAANGYLEQAVSMSSALGDWRGIRDLIIANWETLYMSDSHRTLVRWAELIPPEHIHDSPFLCAALATPYVLSGKMELASSYIKHALRRLKGDEDFLFAFCMVQEAFLASFKARFSDMRSYAEKALKFLPPDEFYLRGMMLQVQATSYYDEDPQKSCNLLLSAVRLQEEYGNKNLACSALSNLAVCCTGLGRLEEGREFAKRAFALYAPEERCRKPMLGHAHLACLLCAVEAGDDEAEARHHAAFERLASLQDGGAENAGEARGLHARAMLRQGDERAAEEFAQALVTSVSGAAMSYPPLRLVRPCVSVVRAQGAALLAGSNGRHAAVRVLMAMAACCQGRVDLAACEEFCAFADGVPQGESLLHVHALVAASLLCEAAACTGRAESYLAKAVEAAQASSLPAAVEENAAELAPIARRLAVSSDDIALVAYLRGLADTSEGRPAASGEESALTERELDVMRLVAAGMSVAEAAQSMVVSRETVKKHLSNIYAKLGVHSKMQAVAALREAGVL